MRRPMSLEDVDRFAALLSAAQAVVNDAEIRADVMDGSPVSAIVDADVFECLRAAVLAIHNAAVAVIEGSRG